MKNHAAGARAKDLFKSWQEATEKARRLNVYAAGDRATRLFTPHDSGDEHAELERMSKGGYGEIVVTSVSQQQFVESHRRSGDTDPSKSFVETWRPNGMVARQLAIHRGANATGAAFLSTMPGTIPGTDLYRPLLRGHSSTRMVAWFDDPSDEFPSEAMEGEVEHITETEKRYRFRLYDDEKVYHIATDSIAGDGAWEVTGVQIHDAGVVPIHRFSPRLDLEGRTIGEIERIIPTLRRLDQDILDRMIVQRFGAWRIKYATGLTKPSTPEEQAAAKLMLAVDSILVAGDKDAKFGTLEPSQLDGFIKAKESDERTLSAQTQIPAYQLSGTVDNVSAEGLAMMQAGLAMHAEEIRTSFGQTYDQVQRTCAYMLDKAYPGQGYLEAALDYETTTIWRDTEINSLTSAANALGTLSEKLGIPPQVLWRRIPGWQKADTDLAEALAKNEGILGELNQLLGDVGRETGVTNEGASGNGA